MNILIVEDAEDDAILIEHVVRSSGLEVDKFQRVDAWEEFVSALSDHAFAVVLLDFHLPKFNALDALEWIARRDLDLPTIIVSGAVGEEMAASLMRAGAKDFIRKENMARLVPAIERELRDHAERAARREAEERERAARAEVAAVRELERLKDLFVSSVSHELRTPIVAIIGYQELLEEELAGPLAPAQREYVQGTLNSVRRLQRLVEDLLDHARLEAGTFKLRTTIRDLTEVVAEAVESMQPVAVSSGVNLVPELAQRPLPVEMDPQRIEQVLANFLGNAIKFTPEGGMVRVRTRPEGEGVWCEVEDTGPGIAPEDVPRLFRPFGQLQAGVAKGGTGLGLAIAKSLVEAHGGRVEVRSAPGRGSTFGFYLPTRLSGPAAPA